MVDDCVLARIASVYDKCPDRKISIDLSGHAMRGNRTSKLAVGGKSISSSKRENLIGFVSQLLSARARAPGKNLNLVDARRSQRIICL
jgi:hypothetical protein